MSFDDAVTADWHVDTEAMQFVRLYLAGRMSIKDVRQNILMTDTQRDWLIRERVADPYRIEEVRRRRVETLREFFKILKKTQRVEIEVRCRSAR